MQPTASVFRRAPFRVAAKRDSAFDFSCIADCRAFLFFLYWLFTHQVSRIGLRSFDAKISRRRRAAESYMRSRVFVLARCSQSRDRISRFRSCGFHRFGGGKPNDPIRESLCEF